MNSESENPQLNAEGQRPCPVCGAIMILERKEEIRADLCEEHGLWLDSGELEKIILHRWQKKRHVRRKALKDAERSGKIQGSFLGWWSLLFD